MGDEPIWAKVDKAYDNVEPPHGYGAKRYHADGNEAERSADAGNVDGDWRVIGWITSGGYAHYVGKSLAQGYIPAELENNDGKGQFEIEILGRRRPAYITPEPLFDPKGEKMRS